jgi:hypothetical protein
VKKPAFNLPAGIFNKTWVFSSPVQKTKLNKISAEPFPSVPSPQTKKISSSTAAFGWAANALSSHPFPP